MTPSAPAAPPRHDVAYVGPSMYEEGWPGGCQLGVCLCGWSVRALPWWAAELALDEHLVWP